MAVSRREFEEKRKERMRIQREQRAKARKMRNIFLILFGVLIILIIVVCASKCKRTTGKTSTPAITVASEAPTNIPVGTSTPAAVETRTGTIPAPEKGDNDLLTVIKNSGQKQHVYLTFDGGPDPKVTPKLLDALRRYNVKGTFFVNGKSIENYPYLCVRMIEEGHLVLPLSYSGNPDSLYADRSSFMEEIDKTYELICNNMPSDTKPFKVYRFIGSSSESTTYGASKASYKDELARNGYYFCDWNADIGDNDTTRSSDALIKYFKDYRPKLNNLIIRVNNTSKNEASAEAIDSIIKTLLSENYIFSRLDEVEISETAMTSNTPEPSTTVNNSSESSSQAPSSTSATAAPTASSSGSSSSKSQNSSSSGNSSSSTNKSSSSSSNSSSSGSSSASSNSSSSSSSGSSSSGSSSSNTNKSTSGSSSSKSSNSSSSSGSSSSSTNKSTQSNSSSAANSTNSGSNSSASNSSPATNSSSQSSNTGDLIAE